MKQYIMGMLTGASLILCAVMFIGASREETGRYQVVDVEFKYGGTNVDRKGAIKVDTKTGKTWFLQRGFDRDDLTKFYSFWRESGRNYEQYEKFDYSPGK